MANVFRAEIFFNVIARAKFYQKLLTNLYLNVIVSPPLKLRGDLKIFGPDS